MEPQSETIEKPRITGHSWLAKDQIDDAVYRMRCTQMIRAMGELKKFAHTKGRKGLYVCAITRQITDAPMVVGGRFVTSRRVADELGRILSPYCFATTLQLTEWMLQTFVRAKPYEWLRLAEKLEQQKLAALSPERINAFRYLLLLYKEAIREALRRDATEMLSDLVAIEKRQKRLRDAIFAMGGDATPEMVLEYSDLDAWHAALEHAFNKKISEE